MDELGVSDLRIKFRSEVDAANWPHRADELFATLAGSQVRTVLAIDELAMLVTKMLKANDFEVTPERLGATDHFLSWLRKNGQAHGDNVPIIVSGSVGLQPILQEAGLSANVNILLSPWTEEVAKECLNELAITDRISLSIDVRHEMCRRLGCSVPHHVQQFYSYLFEELRRREQTAANLSDVERVCCDEMLGMSGQVDLNH